MRGSLSSFVLLLSAWGSSVVAMSPRDPDALGNCRVTAGSKLSTAMNDALCAEVKRAIADAVPGSHFDAEIVVVSRSRLAAQITLNGAALPKQNFAVMDADLDRESIRRFAQSLGDVARAAKR